MSISVLSKRKRAGPVEVDVATDSVPVKKARKSDTPDRSDSVTLQIIAGSYDKILHGIIVTISPGETTASFADSFLFTPHTAPIKCVAVSEPSRAEPGMAQKVMLASGSVDERINVYSLIAHPPAERKDDAVLASIALRPIRESMRNKEIGTLLHHSGAITSLVFPTRSKLISGSADCTIAVTRTRDWNVLSTIKAPKPKAYGRASGDTQTQDTTPSGINCFAMDPSMKGMISVGRGERCMRLWNLMTGKKGGVLNFSKDMLEDVGEKKHSSGEGLKVVWSKSKKEEQFAVMFSRNLVVFSMDSTPLCKILPSNYTAIHAVQYLDKTDDEQDPVLVVATGDGRLLFFSTKEGDVHPAPDGKSKLPLATLFAQLGEKSAGSTSRIKDFVILKANHSNGYTVESVFFVTGSSDGTIRLWETTQEELRPTSLDAKTEPRQIGTLRGKYDTQNRITCMAGFTMIPRPAGLVESEDEEESSSSGDEADDDEDGDDEK